MLLSESMHVDANDNVLEKGAPKKGGIALRIAKCGQTRHGS